jgi:hypothetical protein
MTDTFTCTSNAPYDRHKYELHLKNKQKINFDYWQDLQTYWFQYYQVPDYLDFVVVLDKKKKKGFG